MLHNNLLKNVLFRTIVVISTDRAPLDGCQSVSLFNIIFGSNNHFSFLFYLFPCILFILGLIWYVWIATYTIILLLALELMLFSVSCLFLITAWERGDAFGLTVPLLLLGVAAAESVIGLALIILMHRSKRSVELSNWRVLHGGIVLGLFNELPNNIEGDARVYYFWAPYMITHSIYIYIMLILIILLAVIFSISLYTLGERKLMAAAQRRVGPNVQGYHGLLQPFADGLKLILKEMIIPYKANRIIFFIAPLLFLTLSLTMWALIPFGKHVLMVDSEVSLLILFMFSSLTIYGIIFSGWASNSTYAFLGALRSAAQMISYEVSIGFVFLTVALITSSFSIYDIAKYQEYGIWLLFPLMPLFFIFVISVLAETNRAPFDLPESESELVAGYNVEYSSIIFAMFFLGEYSNMMLMSSLLVHLFFGSWAGINFVEWFIPSKLCTLNNDLLFFF